MAEEKQKPLTRDDVDRLIEENGGTAEGLDLSKRTFRKGIDLRNLDLIGVILNEATLVGANLKGACLTRAHLKKVRLWDAHLEDADLIFADLEEAELMNTYLQGALLTHANLERACLGLAHLEGAKLFLTRLTGAELTAAKISSDTRLEDTDWGNYILGDERKGYFFAAIDVYRQLKTWHTNAGIYDIAGEFFYREMEAKRKAQSWKKKPHIKLWGWVMRLLCGYGERPWQVFASAAVVIFGLAATYFFLGAFSSGTFPGCLYYSVVSFTALGYGSWVFPEPESWAKGLGAAEAIVGVFTIALFLITFVRKMTR